MAIQVSKSLFFVYHFILSVPYFIFVLLPLCFLCLLPILERAPPPGRTIIFTIVFFCHEKFSSTCYAGDSLFTFRFPLSVYISKIDIDSVLDM